MLPIFSKAKRMIANENVFDFSTRKKSDIDDINTVFVHFPLFFYTYIFLQLYLHFQIMSYSRGNLTFRIMLYLSNQTYT